MGDGSAALQRREPPSGTAIPEWAGAASGFVFVLVDSRFAIPFMLMESLLRVAFRFLSAVLLWLRAACLLVREVKSAASEARIVRHRVASSHRLIHTYHTNPGSATVNAHRLAVTVSASSSGS